MLSATDFNVFLQWQILPTRSGLFSLYFCIFVNNQGNITDRNPCLSVCKINRYTYTDSKFCIGIRTRTLPWEIPLRTFPREKLIPGKFFPNKDPDIPKTFTGHSPVKKIPPAASWASLPVGGCLHNRPSLHTIYTRDHREFGLNFSTLSRDIRNPSRREGGGGNSLSYILHITYCDIAASERLFSTCQYAQKCANFNTKFLKENHENAPSSHTVVTALPRPYPNPHSKTPDFAFVSIFISQNSHLATVTVTRWQ